MIKDDQSTNKDDNDLQDLLEKEETHLDPENVTNDNENTNTLELEKQVEELTIISQRALADLQNFKRRNEEEKASFIKGATAGVFLELLPIIESMHRALEHEQKDDNWIEGAVQSMQQLIQTSEKLGLKTVPTEGIFDPTQHEALLTAPGEKDAILEVLEKGYMLNDKIIKMAKVKVGDGSTEEIEKTQSTE